MKRKIALAAAILSAAALSLAIPDGGYALRGKSYMQRGVLSAGGADMPITVYVLSGDSSISMAIEGEAGVLAKVAVSPLDGRELSCSGSTALPEKIVRKFALRDLRAAMGLGGFENAEAVFVEKCGGRTISASSGGYKIEFSEYKKIGETEIPTRLKISCESYSLSLDFISPLNAGKK